MQTAAEQITAAAQHLAPFAVAAMREGVSDEDAILRRALELSEGHAKFCAHILECPKRTAAYKKLMAPLVWLDVQREEAMKSATRGAEALLEAGLTEAR